MQSTNQVRVACCRGRVQDGACSEPSPRAGHDWSSVLWVGPHNPPMEVKECRMRMGAGQMVCAVSAVRRIIEVGGVSAAIARTERRTMATQTFGGAESSVLQHGFV